MRSSCALFLRFTAVRSLPPRNNRKKEVVGRIVSNVESSAAAEDFARPVARIIVEKRPASCQLILEIRQTQSRIFLPFVVASAHGQCNPASGRNDDACWPDFDEQIDWLARCQRLFLIMRMIRPPWLREFVVQLAMRRTQPTLSNRRMRVDCS